MKQLLRSKGISARQSIPIADRISAETAVLERLKSRINWSGVHQVHVYSTREATGEFPTHQVIDHIRNSLSGISLTVGSTSQHAPIPTASYDVIIVPVVAFDNSCHRIGYGGGWYDQFLKDQPEAIKIGLAFEVQKVNKVPAESHDIPLDMIITEGQVYRLNKNVLPK